MKQNELMKDDKKKAYAFLMLVYFDGNAKKAARIMDMPVDVLTELYTQFSGDAETRFNTIVDAKRMEVNARIESERNEENEKKLDRVNLRNLREKLLRRIDEVAETCDDPSKLATTVKAINELSADSGTQSSSSNTVYDFVKKSRRK